MSASSSTPQGASSNPRRNSPIASGKPGKPGGRSSYAPRACQECRRRRVKCGGERPTCSRCLGRQLECVYTTEDDGRGTAPKSYVRLLQARISLLEQILWLHSIDIDAEASRLMQQNAVPATTASLTAGGSTTMFDQLCYAFEGTLALDESLNFDQDGEARYFGPTSGRLAFRTSRDSQECLPPGQSPPPPGLNAQALGDQVGIDEELEAHLLELYFTWDQPWAQHVDEALFRESREVNGRYFSPLLLNCILASGSRYSDRVEVRSDPNDPNTAGRIFLETAEILLFFDVKRPSITTIQSLAILGSVYVAFGQDAVGWLHAGMADRLVLDMGLHLDSGSLVSSNRMTSEEAELRRQLYWSLYCVDKLAAGYTGRICTMLDSQAAVSTPKIPNHAQQGDPRHNLYTISPSLLVSLHAALIKLSQILEKILLNLYAPKKLTLSDQRKNFFDSCLLALKSWLYGLSTNLKPVSAGLPNKFPQAYTLCMVYHTAVILLAKPYIQYAGDSGAPSRLQQPSQQSTAPQGESSSLAKKALAICLEAARSISSLGDQYREVFGSFRKSPITATYANLSAALALLNTQPWGQRNSGLNESDNAKVQSCLRTLEELSTAWTPSSKYHDSILKITQDHSADQQQQQGMACGDSLGPGSLGYSSESANVEDTQLANGPWFDLPVGEMDLGPWTLSDEQV
ncbi:fungal-specific transcription factor domain-containing protein [Dactylonectria macrodidyma]|uniref:Fungal-specific transcription factor domain-containing protein n=1 Tax=Dactylonectria macrodidyma TaxID=307937 RepID=A0A9P9DRE3_9HYPO|nr:fungal-specific transcription factor domain-containing protein [Dactylonectria macrodidyma]